MIINRNVFQRTLYEKRINTDDLKSKGIPSAALIKIVKGEEVDELTVQRVAAALDISEERLLKETSYSYLDFEISSFMY